MNIKPTLKDISSYLNFRHVIDEEPLELNGRIIDPTPGWFTPKLKLSEEQIVKEAKNLLAKSIALNIPQKGHIEIALSSGADSALLAAMIDRDDVHASSIQFKGDKNQEATAAKKIAKHLGIKHNILFMSPSRFADWNKKAVTDKKAPMSCQNEPAFYYMAKAVQSKYEGGTVVVGSGADEIFGGYSRLFKSPLYYDKKIYGSKVDYLMGDYGYFPEKDNLFIKETDDSWIYNKLEKLFASPLSHYDQMVHFIYKYHFPSLISRIKTINLATGVNVAAPFFDKALTQFCFRTPLDKRIPWKPGVTPEIAKKYPLEKMSEKMDTPKNIEKEILCLFLPREMVHKKKIGFPVPFDDWFKGPLKKELDILLEDKSKIQEFMDYRRLSDFIDSSDWVPGWGFKVWELWNVELWLRSLNGSRFRYDGKVNSKSLSNSFK